MVLLNLVHKYTVFYKKNVYKKHEAKSRQKLGNIGRLL